MATLFGAIAYKSHLVGKQVIQWEDVRQDVNGQRTVDVACPHCGELYGLIEEIGVSDDILEQDRRFLLKGLESVHPDHPPCVIVRDQQGVLWRLTGRGGECSEPVWETEQAA